MRTKPQAGAGATPSTTEGEKTVIHVGPEDVHQRRPRQIKVKQISLLDVIGYAVLASTLLLGAFMALAFALDRLRDWLSV